MAISTGSPRRSRLNEQVSRVPWSKSALRYPAGQFSDRFPERDFASRKWRYFDQMRRDPVLAGALQIKKWLTVCDGWRIHPADESAQALEQADLIRRVLLDAQGTIEGLVDNILDACGVGYSVQEIVWGEARGLTAPVAFLPISPAFVGFDVQDTGATDILLTIPGQANQELLEDWRALLYTYNGRYGSPLGQGDFVRCFRSWWAKDRALGWWSKRTEMSGVPTRIGTYEAGASTAVQGQLHDVITVTAADQAIVKPSNQTLEFWEPSGDGESLKKFVDYHNKEIAQGVLGTVLLMSEGEHGGNRALGKVQYDVSMALIRRLKREVEEDVMGAQLIRRIVDMNWGQQSEYPRFVLSEPPVEEWASRVAGVVDMVGAGLLERGDPWIREFLGMPAEGG